MAPERVAELIGVYNADGGLRGELSYVIGKVRASAHCELCDITHSPIRRKQAWKDFTTGLGVPFRLLHRNDIAPGSDIALAIAHNLPCVLARTQTGSLVLLLGAAEMSDADGDVASFSEILHRKLGKQGLSLAD